MNIALLAYIYDLDQPGHCSDNITDMNNIIAFDSLDTLGLKLFHMDIKGSCPIWRSVSLLGVCDVLLSCVLSTLYIYSEIERC